MLDDHANAPISDKEKALFDFIEKINRESPSITREDLDHLRELGWTDDALYDAITVCALFNFYNKWIDATGVSDMAAGAYEASGERLATRGYSKDGG